MENEVDWLRAGGKQKQDVYAQTIAMTQVYITVTPMHVISEYLMNHNFMATNNQRSNPFTVERNTYTLLKVTFCGLNKKTQRSAKA